MSGEAAREKRAKQARWLWRLVRRGRAQLHPRGGYFSVLKPSHDATTAMAAPLADKLETTKCALPLVARLFRCGTDTFFLPPRQLAEPRKLILKNHLYFCRTLKMSHAMSDVSKQKKVA